jgi:hypothetical protein
MPIYADNSTNHPDQGMTEADMLAVRDVAARRNEIIMFRDTGCWSRPYIARGHPTKPFHVKGKSSNWGPHAGLVPYDSEFSKATSEKDIAKGRALNKAAIAGNFARPIPVFIDDAFLAEHLLVPKGSRRLPPVNLVTRPREGVMYFYCTKPSDDATLPGKDYILLGKRTSDGRWQLHTFPENVSRVNERELFLKESSAVPMLVMSVPGATLPITGDYDLFAVCPSWGSYGGMDRKMDPTLDNPKQNASFARTTKPSSIAAIKAAFTPEDPDRGNLTPRLLEVVNALVAQMGGAHPRVHHNAESGRPFAPRAEDGFPLTVFHPRRGIGAVSDPENPKRNFPGFAFLNATIDDVGDLRTYFERLYAGGYYPPRNHAWKMESLRDDSAVKAKLETQLLMPRRGS